MWTLWFAAPEALFARADKTDKCVRSLCFGPKEGKDILGMEIPREMEGKR